MEVNGRIFEVDGAFVHGLIRLQVGDVILCIGYQSIILCYVYE